MEDLLMRRDSTAFRNRFERWKNGEQVYENGRVIPGYETGKDDEGESNIPLDKRARAMYNAIDPRGDVPQGYLEAIKKEMAVRRKMYFGDPDKMEYEVGSSVAEKVSDAAWRKRLGYGYDKKLLIPNGKNTVRLPKDIEKEIPIDTTMLKNRIAATEKLMNYSRKYKYNKYIQLARDVDKQALEALRETYKSGRPVTINEHSFNSRQWVSGGEVKPTMSPLNVLGNFQIWYDKDSKKIKYKDTYDFNEYDWAIPGNPYDISGYLEDKNTDNEV